MRRSFRLTSLAMLMRGLHPAHHWDSFHSNWATRIADALNERALPDGYLAEEHTHVGSVEIDVASFRSEGAPGASSSWTPPAPTSRIAWAVPDTFEVRILTDRGGATLVGVIELVSPGNKDRAEQRRAFAAKCVGFLQQGASLVLVDVVTTRTANLHNEIALLLGAPEVAMPEAVSLYVAAWRPLVDGGTPSVDIWTMPCEVGAPSDRSAPSRGRRLRPGRSRSDLRRGVPPAPHPARMSGGASGRPDTSHLRKSVRVITS